MRARRLRPIASLILPLNLKITQRKRPKLPPLQETKKTN